MPFCATCGTQVEGRFCAKCGTPVGAAASAAAPGAAPIGSMPPPMATTSAGMADNVASTLCYVLGFITGIIFLVLEPYNRNRVVRFHAFQSIFLSVAVIALRIALSIVFTALWSVSGFFLSFALSSLVSLACFILWLYILISTYQGKTIVLPVIGPLAQQQAG
jgi:uncharacterized membrane protein